MAIEGKNKPVEAFSFPSRYIYPLLPQGFLFRIILNNNLVAGIGEMCTFASVPSRNKFIVLGSSS